MGVVWKEVIPSMRGKILRETHVSSTHLAALIVVPKKRRQSRKLLGTPG